MAHGLLGVRRLRATLMAVVLAALVLGVALLAHSRAQNDTEITTVMLDPGDAGRDRLGDLVYLGGLHIPRMGQDIGGLSALRWDAGRLIALTDDARWVSMMPLEQGGRLTGIAGIETGALLGTDGETLTGKARGDSESMTRSAKGGWLVGFERDHRIWRYPGLGELPVPSGIDPLALLGDLADNSGIEALAGDERALVLCAERQVAGDTPNCMRTDEDMAQPYPLFARPAAAIAQLGGVPTGADMGADGTFYIVFRSYSRQDGNGASIIAYGPDLTGPNPTRRELMSLRPPFTIDNFEGLAVREEGTDDDRRTFLYIVSDDNFSSRQRTLLMKFEVIR